MERSLTHPTLREAVKTGLEETLHSKRGHMKKANDTDVCVKSADTTRKERPSQPTRLSLLSHPSEGTDM